MTDERKLYIHINFRRNRTYIKILTMMNLERKECRKQMQQLNEYAVHESAVWWSHRAVGEAANVDRLYAIATPTKRQYTLWSATTPPFAVQAALVNLIVISYQYHGDLDSVSRFRFECRLRVCELNFVEHPSTACVCTRGFSHSQHRCLFSLCWKLKVHLRLDTLAVTLIYWWFGNFRARTTLD